MLFDVQLSTEHKIVLLCARMVLTDKNKQQIRQLVSTAVDWQYLLHWTFYHRVTPLIYRNLKSVAKDIIPEKNLAILHLANQHIESQNKKYGLELIKILHLFQENGIQLLACKGPVLAVQFYGNLALRQFSDLDLLLPENMMDQARKLLTERGYHPHPVLSREQEKVLARSWGVLTFVQHKEKIVIDLHWRLSSIGQWFLERDQLWQCHQTTTILNIPIPTLALNDTVQHLCYHGAKHRWENLFWLCDLAEVIRSGLVLDWEDGMARAKQLDNHRAFALGFTLAHLLLDSPLPEPIAQYNRTDRLIPILSKKVCALLFQSPKSAPLGQCAGRNVFAMQLHTRIRGKLSIFYNRLVIPQPEDWAAMPWLYAGSLWFFLLRPIRLFVKYILRC